MTASPENDLTPEERQGIDTLYQLAIQGNHYALLGVAVDADSAHIRAAYYEFVRVWHPDRFYRREIGAYKDVLEVVAVAANKAYGVLSSSEERQAWNEENAAVLERISGVRPITPSPGSVIDDKTEGQSYEVARPRGWFESPEVPATPLVRAERPRRHLAVPGLDKVRQQIVTQLTKARRYFKDASEAAAQNNWISAASAMRLASRFDPENEAYKQLTTEYGQKGREQAARQAIAAAEAAEGYHNVKSAMFHYERACAVDPPFGLAFFRLAQLKLKEEGDRQEILRLLRVATEKEPNNAKFRLFLAQYYVTQNLNANARREFERVLVQEPNNIEAKAGLKKVKQ